MEKTEKNTNNNFDYKAVIKKKLDDAVVQSEKSIAGFFIKNYRFTYLIIFFILISGLYSLLTLPKEAEPEVRVPFAVVTTVYPGATPTDIEELITQKIEDKIDNLENLNNYNSTSGQNFSSIFVEYNAEADLKESFRKLREAVDEAEPKLPDDAEAPVVTEINFNDFPIVTYSLVGDYNEAELKKYADILKDEFESISEVSKAEILGGVEREFQVIVNQTKLANYNISLSQVIGAIQANNISLPAGDIEIDGYKYNVRVDGKFTEIEKLNDIVIATYNNSPVFLHDLALVQDSYKEKETESKIGFSNENSKKTISLQIYKKTGGNILNIVENSQLAINKLYENNSLPEDIKIEKTNDNSVYIKNDLSTLGSSGLQTVILINIILMLILSFRGALITAMAVPIAFLMSFLFLLIQDMTLNSMVLFSLVLSLGLMVDNAIIIIEGINEYVSEHRRTIYEAALLSIWNFKWAITSGTMTTVSAFLPMLLVSGIMGEYMSILPKTISVTLLSSLFVAIIIIPTLATRFIKIKTDNGHKHRNKKRHLFLERKIKKLKENYTNFLWSVLPDKKRRRLILAGVFILFILAALTPISGIMKIQMFPKIDIDYFVINIKLPVGSVLDSTRIVTEEAEKIVQEIPELENYVVNLGASASLGFGGGSSMGANKASLTVNLKDKDERERKSYEIAESIRAQIEKIQGGDVTLEELAAGPPTGSPIEVRIYGDDLTIHSKIADKITKYFENIDNVINVKNSIQNSTGEFTYTIDKQKANYYGLDIFTVASTLRNAIYGTNASVVNIDGEDVDITVKYDNDNFTNTNDLNNILLFTRNGDSIPLNQIASTDFNPALLNIYHRDGEKITTVTADLKKGANLQKILADFDAYKKNIEIPETYLLQVGGETEDIEKSFREIFTSMIVAIILIAFILVLQFNSFKQPFIIIFSLPLAVIGVAIGLNLLRLPFSLPAFIGIVSLSGIVVNDAIVLIDRINKNIKNGLEFFAAIIEAGNARMQPIFLTSLTTIAGIFPLVYSDELWRGLSITVISGLIFSTFLTLIIVPIFYASMCQKEKCLK